MHECGTVYRCAIIYIFKNVACSGQRVVVQEKNGDKVIEHVVTIQVWHVKTILPELHLM